ncbi:MAG: hypothetical protein IKP11_00875 [Paludibacteraceae bacterium]|nr:hypothetical protein [Paludibacteraceae bacterium]
MRKLFSILAVALLALSAHATVVTKEYDLADLTKQQESTTWSANELTVTKGWDGIAHDYGEYPYNAEDYTELTLELASTSEVGVNLTIQYSDNSKSDKTINAGSLIARIPLSNSFIKRIDIKLTAAGSATISKLYFSKVIGKETVTNLFTGSNTFDWGWTHRILIPNTAFASIHEGDRIQFTYTSGASGQCQVRVQDLGDENNQLTETGEYAGITQGQVEPATFSFVLRAEDIEKVQTNGLYFHGNDYTVTNIKLYTYAKQIMVETELAHGAEVIDWNAHWEHTEGLPTLAAGDELRVVLSAKDESNNYQIYFKYDWEEGHEIGVTGIDATLPKVYSVVLTAEQATAINTAGKLFVNGTGVTLSRFSIAQPMSIYDESILWSGEQAVTDGWSGNVTIEKEALADIKEGNIICVQLSAVGGDDADDQVLLKYGDSWTDFSPAVNYLFQANLVAPMTVEIPVTAKMRDQLRGNKLVVTGKDFTMTHVFIKEGTPVNTNSHFVTVTSAGMATLVLPFDVPNLPDGVQAYNLTNNGDATIWANEVNVLEADKPVLIIAPEGEYEFISEEGASDDITSKTGTFTNGALVGTYTTIAELAQTTGGNYNYVLNNQGGNVGFYQVRDNTCSVAPYRAYLSCGYDASDAGPSQAPMRIVFHKDTTTGIENVQGDKLQSTKVFENGILYIMNNGIKYNVQGQLCK